MCRVSGEVGECSFSLVFLYLVTSLRRSPANDSGHEFKCNSRGGGANPEASGGAHPEIPITLNKGLYLKFTGAIGLRYIP